MPDAPERFVEWMGENVGFNPRSGKYSDALSLYVIDDFADACGLMKERMETAYVRAEPNADVTTLSATRNVDLVLWGPEAGDGVRQVQRGLENKLILAAHGKARKNRLGDIIAFANHVHNAAEGAIAAGLIGVNISAEYANPDPFAEGMNHPKPEAFGVFVFRYDGRREASLVTEPPAPQPGDPLHYTTFMERVVQQYEQRHQ